MQWKEAACVYNLPCLSLLNFPKQKALFFNNDTSDEFSFLLGYSVNFPIEYVWNGKPTLPVLGITPQIFYRRV